MCQASKVTKDWVNKGCHIHIGPVELVVFPDHKGGVGFRPFFAVKDENVINAALKVAEDVCLPNAYTRKLWIRSLRQATAFMLSFDEQPRRLANGRMLEFKFLSIALIRYAE